MSGTTRIASADFEEAARPEVGRYYDPSVLFMVPPLARERDKVAIVGFTDHRVEALKLGDDFELWGLNELYRYMDPTRFHRWFEIHGREYLCQDDEGKRHIADLATALGGMPIYMQTVHADIPRSVRFPIDELIEHFGGRSALGADYFTNCPAQMLSFAIAMGYREIHMYGVDMAQDSEYGTQRPCCEFWLGRALGLGIKVHVPGTSDLLKCLGTYGYEDAGSDFSRKLQGRIKFLHERDNEILRNLRGMDAQYQQQHKTLTERAQRAEGAIAELETERRTERVKDRLTALRAELATHRGSLAGLENEYNARREGLMAERNRTVGGIQDCEFWLRSWSMKATMPGGGAIPSQATRAADAQTGITAPSDDTRQPAGAGA